MTTEPTTPSQTVGPFFAMAGGLAWPDGPRVVPDGTPGAVRIAGRVLDGEGEPVPDALVETWQADPDGRFAHPDDPRGAVDGAFRSFGRCATDADGRYWIQTVKPGPLPAPGGRTQAPHIDVSVLARGMLDRLVTRIYFPDEAAANAQDPVLSEIGDERARGTLVARPTQHGLSFDVHLQGPDETVFFTI
jgi:protocatechuate 3,4-dioxygenase alpha subunit